MSQPGQFTSQITGPIFGSVSPRSLPRAAFKNELPPFVISDLPQYAQIGWEIVGLASGSGLTVFLPVQRPILMISLTGDCCFPLQTRRTTVSTNGFSKCLFDIGYWKGGKPPLTTTPANQYDASKGGAGFDAPEFGSLSTVSPTNGAVFTTNNLQGGIARNTLLVVLLSMFESDTVLGLPAAQERFAFERLVYLEPEDFIWLHMDAAASGAVTGLTYGPEIQLVIEYYQLTRKLTGDALQALGKPQPWYGQR